MKAYSPKPHLKFKKNTKLIKHLLLHWILEINDIDEHISKNSKTPSNEATLTSPTLTFVRYDNNIDNEINSILVYNTVEISDKPLSKFSNICHIYFSTIFMVR